MSDLEEFRRRVRAHIVAHAPPFRGRTGTRSPENDEQAEILRQWSASLYEHGFLGGGWPVEFGGRPDADPDEELVVSEELARAGVPAAIGAGALAAHAIITFGSHEQQRFFLPRIRSYDDVWCQLFSEPDAGSDLASMKTRAVRDGDTFVVEGQKVWSTNAKFAQWGYLLARTDPGVVKQAGITAFALDMTTPGIDVRPLREMTGTADFNEVFFDGVRVPAERVIGAVNDGWRVATVSLAEERALVGGLVVRLRLNLAALIEMARRTGPHGRPGVEDPVIRQALAGFATRVEIASQVVRSSADRRRRGASLAQDVPMTKLGFAVLNEEMSHFGIRLQGVAGTLAEDDVHAVDGGKWQDEFLYAKAYTISGGSNEIMRNLLAERALGLPRG
ncbi:MAG: acyl-CoA dehydrogenase family protein [Acidimicrobiales bacterium]